MIIETLRAQLDAYDQAALYEQENFRGRAEVIDAIEFAIIDRIEAAAKAAQGQPGKGA